MSRFKKKIQPVTSYALVVDGETELWYFQMLKRNERQIRVNIKPEIPSKKRIDEQFAQVVNLAMSEYDKVFWIIDLDTILKESKAAPKYDTSQMSMLITYSRKITTEYPNVKIIINNPCFEFWFLLHFERTTRPFRNCSEVQTQLKVHLKDYEKSRKYFTRDGKDIYLRLKPNLKTAIENATSIGRFDANAPDRSLSEMFAFFESNELKKIS